MRAPRRPTACQGRKIVNQTGKIRERENEAHLVELKRGTKGENG
jgi:hypothetical protein